MTVVTQHDYDTKFEGINVKCDIPQKGEISFVFVCLLSGKSRDGTVMRALASHQYDPRSIPGLGVTCGLSLLLVLVLALRSFPPTP